MRDMGYVEGTPAAICQTALEALKVMYFKKFGQQLSDKQALFVAGIHVEGGKDADQHVSLESYVHKFRHQDNPSKVSEELVHHGWVRKQVEGVDANGKIIYSDKDHPLQSLYFNIEVVTGTMVPLAFTDILEVGVIDDYRKGNKRDEVEFIDVQQKVVYQDMARRILHFCEIDENILEGDCWDALWKWCLKSDKKSDSLKGLPTFLKDVEGVETFIHTLFDEIV